MKNFALKITFVFIFQFAAFGQTLRPELKELIQNIEKENVLNYEAVGIAGIKTEQYQNFENLKKIATNQELLQILKNKDTVVKGYASWALADNKYPNISEILDDFITNKYTVRNQDGCIIDTDDLALIFNQRVYYQNVYNDLSKSDSLFFENQIQKSNEVILTKLKSGFLFDRALLSNRKNPKTYDRIKKLALNDNNNKAIKAFGEYQKESDIETIKNLGVKAFPAISQFPDKSFWSFLQSYKGKIYSEDYFMAISAYKNEESEILLQDILEKTPLDSIYNIHKSVMQNYSPIYVNILYSIWKKRSLIDHKATKLLIENNPQKAAKSFSEVLLSPDKLRFVEYNHEYGTNEKILPLMFGVIEKYEKAKVQEICKIQIPISDFTRLSFFLKIAEENNFKECSLPIFERLNQKVNAYEIFHLSETLFSFKDDKINNLLIPILKEKQEKWDWGNWSESFQELFTKNNINW